MQPRAGNSELAIPGACQARVPFDFRLCLLMTGTSSACETRSSRDVNMVMTLRVLGRRSCFSGPLSRGASFHALSRLWLRIVIKS